jgi:uncharacterized protein
MNRSRFIAGAVCPACGAVDRVVVDTDSDTALRTCVACNYSDTMRLRSKPSRQLTRAARTATSSVASDGSGSGSERIGARNSD